MIVPMIGFGQEYNYYGEKEASELCNYFRANNFSSDRDAEIALEKILSVLDIKKKFAIYACDDIDNALATIHQGVRYILYDPDFMNSIAGTSWSNLSILAHEVGHHILGHMLDNNEETYSESQNEELEADEFSGYVMYLLGASLKDAQLVFRNMEDYDDSYSSHPTPSKRLKAIKKGYKDAKRDGINTKQKGSFEFDELPLSAFEIRERYPNGMCGWNDKNDNILFNGGDFDINHPDANKVAYFGCLNFSGEYLNSSCYREKFEADRFGNILSPLEVVIMNKGREYIAEIEYNKDGTFEVYEYK